MLYCNDCQQFIEEEDTKIRREKVGEYAGAPAYRSYVYCPQCGSDQLEEARRCPVCGEWKPDDLYDYCEACRDDAYDMLSIMLLNIQERNKDTTRSDVLGLMADTFDRFYEAKL